ncbi:hypothetical protein [Nitrosospira briensis]|uniref:hypothetical protein n=1 Tax=Nitrosospira briensis TaxID=35799 RepID=UPI000469735D|nr:hypothetical protein [Nitrosospira briensis]
MGTDYDNAAVVNVRSFVLRYMQAHGAETSGVRAELDQLQAILSEAVTRLMSSFEAIRAYSARHLQPAADDVFDSAKTAPAAALGATHAGQCKPAGFTADIEDSINEAMTALQFHDIASQILAHTRRRIEFLERMAEQLEQLPDTTIKDLDHAIRKACTDRGHNPVGQAVMTVGAVELF